MANLQLKEWTVFQDKILKEVRSKAPNQKLSSVLAKTLSISENAAYKKIQGGIQFSIQDLLVLSKEFQISLDQFISHKASPIPFYSDAIRKKPDHYRDYFLNIQKHVTAISQIKELNYIYQANEIPIFHYLLFPSLLYFKIYAWNYTSWRIGDSLKAYEYLAFQRDDVMQKAIHASIETYFTFPGTEIWHIRMFDITLDQLKYFIHLRVFQDKSTVLQILDDLYDMLDHLNLMASKAMKLKRGQKVDHSAHCKMYINELVSTSDIIFVGSPDMEIVFTMFDTPNLVRTSDQRFTAYTKVWMEHTIRHSSLISNEGERERVELFQTYRQKLDQGRREIEGLRAYKYS